MPSRNHHGIHWAALTTSQCLVKNRPRPAPHRLVPPDEHPLDEHGQRHAGRACTPGSEDAQQRSGQDAAVEPRLRNRNGTRTKTSRYSVTLSTTKPAASQRLWIAVASSGRPCRGVRARAGCDPRAGSRCRHAVPGMRVEG